jgi:ABC-type sugar transport system substrate-binding protein
MLHNKAFDRGYRGSIKRLLAWAMAAAIAGGALSACGSSSSTASSASGGASSTPTSSATGGTLSTSAPASASVSGKKAFLIMAPPAVPYAARQIAVITAGLKAQGVQTTAFNDGFTPDGEVAGLNQAIAAHADVIGYQANFQAAARGALLKAKEAHIPVVLLATTPEPEIKGLYSSYAGPDEAGTGALVARRLQQALGTDKVKSGDVAALLGLASSYSVKIRQAGFDSQLATTPGFKVVGNTDGQWDPARTVTQGNQVAAQYGKQIVGMYVHGGVQAAAVAQAIKRNGLKVGTKPGDIFIVSNNCDTTSIQAIKDGLVLLTTEQGPATDGRVEAQAMVQALEGHPRDMATPNNVIDASNVDTYAKDCTY